MNKFNQFIGIDISKDVFDISLSKKEHHQFTNDKKGFIKFKKLISSGSLCVMEATGVYHQSLALFLYSKGVAVSVENPLKIKRFIQMNLRKEKTDKADSYQILLYAQKIAVKLWQPKEIYLEESSQINSLLSFYKKEQTATRNRIHAIKVLPRSSKTVLKSLKLQLKSILKEINKLEIELLRLIKDHEQQLLTNLESIPGIGRRTATYLIVMTDGFKKFEKAKQLCSYAGITPIIRESGSSIRGKSRISKIGDKEVRNLLFMCSFTACKSNKSCKQIYSRITAKGKSKKLALIAVSNKLLKQAFAIAKSGLKYDENFVSVKPEII